jgi:hypothetical protein
LADDRLPAEQRIEAALANLPLDFHAMVAISNLFRASTAIRRHMEANVLAEDRLSWTSFVGFGCCGFGERWTLATSPRPSG